MKMRPSSKVTGIIALLLAGVVFLVPFAFIVLQSLKTRDDAQKLEFSLPEQFNLVSNVVEVFQARDFMLIRAFINSTILTVASVALMVLCAALAGYVLQRRTSRINPLVELAIMAGLIIPPAVVPTIWVLQHLKLFKTLPGMILVEVALGLAFCIMLFRAFIASVPRELDEAAVIDGAGPMRLFFSVIFPLLRGVTITVIVVQSVAVFNDFTGPLYFLPGDNNATVQLTLYNFQSQYATQWNLLFTNILLITIPPLIMFIFFNKRIVEGMTAGSVKG
jgi:raffinose/stachyose/melibiose transport system permease protein